MQLPVRESFYKALLDGGFLRVLQAALVHSPPRAQLWCWLAVLDMLNSALNHDPNALRQFVLAAVAQPRESTLMARLFAVVVDPSVRDRLACRSRQVANLWFALRRPTLACSTRRRSCCG